MRNVRNLVLALAGSALLVGSAAAQVTLSRPRLVQKVYAVADLVADAAPQAGEEESSAFLSCCPEMMFWSTRKTDSCGEDQKLIRLITSTVRPKCWAAAGGDCSIEFFPIGMGLVVSAPDDVQQQVECALESMRQKRAVSIGVSLRFITVDEDFFQRFGLDLDLSATPGKADCCEKNGCFGNECCEKGTCDKQGCCKEGCCKQGSDKACCAPTTAIGMTEQQVKLFLEAVHGDRRACVTSAPRITIVNGSAGTINLQERHHYCTGVTISNANGVQQVVPQNMQQSTGLTMTVKGDVSADQKYIALNLVADHTYLEDSRVAQSPVTFLMNQRTKNGGPAESVPVTQMIQHPKFRTLKINTRLTVPTGGTMLVHGGVIERTTHQVSAPAMLNKMPYLTKLFQQARTVTTREHMLILVTPTIVPDASVAQAPCPACPAAQHCPAAQACPAVAQPAPAPTAPKSSVTARATIRACGVPTTPAAPTTSSQVAYGTAVHVMPAPLVPRPTTAPQDRVIQSAAKLVQMYRAACAKGQLDEARELARVALDLDPMCFTRSSGTVMPAPATSPTPPMPIMPPQPRFVPASSVTPGPSWTPQPNQSSGRDFLQPKWNRRYRLIITARVSRAGSGQATTGALSLEPELPAEPTGPVAMQLAQLR